jgi:hypothetical protein
LCILVFIIIVLPCPIINYIFHVPSAVIYLQCYLLCDAPVFRHTLCKYLTLFYLQNTGIVHMKCHTCVCQNTGHRVSTQVVCRMVNMTTAHFMYTMCHKLTIRMH